MKETERNETVKTAAGSAAADGEERSARNMNETDERWNAEDPAETETAQEPQEESPEESGQADDGESAGTEIDAAALMEDAPEEGGGTPNAEEDADTGDEAADEAEAADREAMRSGYEREIDTLMQDGWTADGLRALIEDAAVREALTAGKTLRQAAHRYLTAQTRAVQRPIRRSGVPTTRTSMGAARTQAERIEQMTEDEFERFSKRVDAMLLEGRRVRL